MTSTKASLDRIEGDYAVLILNNKNTDQVIVPANIMPHGIKDGDIVSISISMDNRETEIAKRRVAEMLRELQDGDKREII